MAALCRSYSLAEIIVSVLALLSLASHTFADGSSFRTHASASPLQQDKRSPHLRSIATETSSPTQHKYSRSLQSVHIAPSQRLSPTEHQFAGEGSNDLCSFKVDGPLVRKVLQVNGSADDVIRVSMCPKNSADLTLTRLVESTTRDDVLSVGSVSPTDVHIDSVVSEVSGCRNMTVSFIFEKLVGQTNYSLSLLREGETSTQNSLCSVTVPFLVAGISLYTTTSESNEVTRISAPTNISGSGRYEFRSISMSGMTISLYSGINSAFSDTFRTNQSESVMLTSVRTQFLDGTTDDTIDNDKLHALLLDLAIVSPEGESQPVAFNELVCAPVALVQPPDSIPPQLQRDECGAGFGEIVAAGDGGASGKIGQEKLVFAFRVDPFRIGHSLLVLQWNGFTTGEHDFEEEMYTNTFESSISGNPPPIVLAIKDPGPLFRSGGDVLQVTLANTEGSSARQLIVNGVVFEELQGAYKDNQNGLQVTKFVSAPGNGTSLPWAIRVVYPDGTVKVSDKLQSGRADLLHYESGSLRLGTISPEYGKAGEKVTLTGYFDGFNISDVGHGVYFDNSSVVGKSLLREVHESGSRIEFILPDREDVGSAYEYNVSVMVQGESTNPLKFFYEPEEDQVKPVMTVFGASYNSSQSRYEVGSCSNSMYVLSFPQGIPEPEKVAWSLHPTSAGERIETGQDLLENETDPEEKFLLLQLRPRHFQNQTGEFVVQASVDILGKKVQAQVSILKLSTPVIGVQIFKPAPRAKSVPNAPLRLNSYLDPPAIGVCFNGSARIIYDWTIGNATTRFSFANFTESEMGTESIPARLGREFVIPREKLQYGETNVTLRAFMMDDPSVSGVATTSISIEAPPLVAVIGNGETRTKRSMESSFTLSAENSFDPDAQNLGLEDSDIDVYKWSCSFSGQEDASSGLTKCGQGFLPDPNASQFSVDKDVLRAIGDVLAARNGNNGHFYIFYELTVGKDFRLSKSTLQVIEVSPEPFEVAVLPQISLTDNQGVAIGWDNVRSYESVLLVPGGDGLSWAISVLEPVQERNTLLNGLGVIQHPGYYSPDAVETAQSLPLGFVSGALTPGTRYVFEISVFDSRPSIEEGRTVVEFKTLASPRLIFPDLEIVTGDTQTLFYATATVNLDTSFVFSYYFYLIDLEGEEHCVDGCSGAPHVQFKVEHAGSYQIRCQLVDTLGKSTLDVVVNSATITVAGSPVSRALSSRSAEGGISAAEYGNRIHELHWAGDHGNLELLVSTMSTHLRRAGVVQSSEDNFAALDTALQTMHQVIMNSAPTTRTSKSYVRTAARLAGVESAYFATEEVMYTCLSMVNKALVNVPHTEADDSEGEVQLFYNLTIPKVMATITEFSARVRLQQFGAGSGLDARSLVIDSFRLQENHMLRSITKKAECGMQKSLSTIVDGGSDGSTGAALLASASAARARLIRSTRGAASSVNAGASPQNSDSSSLNSRYESEAIGDGPLMHSTLSVSVLCNKEQGDVLQGDKSEFRWCDSVFESPEVRVQSSLYGADPKSRVVFSVFETIDYAWLSGLGADLKPSDTQFLVTTNVSRLGENNTLHPISVVPKGCFRINTTMSRLGVSPNRGCLSVAGFSLQSLQMPFEPKVMLKDYQRNNSAVETAVATDMTSTIALSTDYPGIFGAQGVDCPTTVAPPPYEMPPNKSNVVAYALTGVGALIAIGAMLTWVSANAFMSHAAPV